MNKRKIREFFGPSLVRAFQKFTSIIWGSRLSFAPKAWNTKLPNKDADGWNSESLIGDNLAKWDRITEICNSKKPMGFSYEETDLDVIRDVSFHNIHITFGYVVALASRMKSKLSILDWGGGVGHYNLIAKALVPEVEINYHCVEVPNMVKVVKEINKDVTWVFDKSYTQNSYDLVMVNASLQYVRNWKEFMFEMASITNEYFFLTRIPVVENASQFLALQKEGNSSMLHIQFNETELLNNVSSAGFTLLREFVVGDKPFIKFAPEQCELRGWLFKKNK